MAHVSRGDTEVPEEVKEEHPAEPRRPIHWNYAHKQIPLNSKARVTAPGNAVSVYTDLVSLEQGEGEKPFSLEEEREGRVIDTHVKRESSRQNDDIKWSKAHGRGSLKRSPRHDFLPYSPRKKGRTAMMSTSGGTSKFTAPGPGLFKRSRGIASMSADIRCPARPWPRVELSSDDESSSVVIVVCEHSWFRGEECCFSPRCPFPFEWRGNGDGRRRGRTHLRNVFLFSYTAE